MAAIPVPAVSNIRLEKAAMDTGFDLVHAQPGPWLPFSSSQAPLRIWLCVGDGGGVVVALSMLNVSSALAALGLPSKQPVPEGAVAAHILPGVPELHRFLRRAFQLSKTLPDELLHVFNHATAKMPKTTEAERLVVTRVGQDIFRKGLLDYWEKRCAITGLGQVELLRASHIKPWADCATDAERLDVFNGLLLAPHLDALFDAGFISVANDGAVMVAAALKEEDRKLLGVTTHLHVDALEKGHLAYLPWHREKVFKGSVPKA